MKKLQIIILIFFSIVLNAQSKVYSLHEGKELNELFIFKEKVVYINKNDTVRYTLKRESSESLAVNNDNFSFSIFFEKENTIKILPFNFKIKTNSELYKYLKNSILNENEIQKIGLLFYPINRFYDDCCLYFNHDIFIKDWDHDMYSPKFKIISVEQLEKQKIILKGIYRYKNNVIDKINYYKDDGGSLFEFYAEKLNNVNHRDGQYDFIYYASNEKYILRGMHFRNKYNRVMKAVYKEENMSNVSKTKNKTYNYPYLKVEIKKN
ncbi:hypothetical protein [Chryseobacterium sp. ERMR1:04]|uniref:hypothetical protein n=1 Tax=Chryseobacterium sp. ERMR1:04 TaxID=1705393 RepID=UPI0006C859FB|nr:hypothetical protein [Chryseobacterium sp. ERMR1:04]KPH14448.1 hypothetical protein AMQ68_02905 [Chryseobacterium sp. ERMR1:04]